MRGGIRQDSEKKRSGASTIRRKRRREGESGVVWTSGERDVRNVATLRQDVRNVATQVQTHRTHRTQNIRRLRQDATPADQTQDPFSLMCVEALDFVLSLPDRMSLGGHTQNRSLRYKHLERPVYKVSRERQNSRYSFC